MQGPQRDGLSPHLDPRPLRRGRPHAPLEASECALPTLGAPAAPREGRTSVPPLRASSPTGESISSAALLWNLACVNANGTYASSSGYKQRPHSAMALHDPSLVGTHVFLYCFDMVLAVELDASALSRGEAFRINSFFFCLSRLSSSGVSDLPPPRCFNRPSHIEGMTQVTRCETWPPGHHQSDLLEEPRFRDYWLAEP
nr:hypothetical protein Iba_chr02aCG11140 [Ipomoea batatas]